MPLSKKPNTGLARITTPEKIYESLVEELLSGHLIPGEKLQERDIADYYQVSRTPLREAIRKLEHDGFLVSEPYRGVFVRDYDLEEVDKLFELRIELESMAVRLATERASHEDITEMEEAIGRYERMIEIAEETIPATVDLHMLIAQSAQNPWLYRIIFQIQVHCSLLRYHAHMNPERRRAIYEEHSKLVEAIKDRNVDGAEKILREHVYSARQFLLQSLNGEEGEFRKVAQASK